MKRFCEGKLNELIQINTDLTNSISEMEKEKLRIEGAYTAYNEMKEYLDGLENGSDGHQGISEEPSGTTVTEFEIIHNEDQIQNDEPVMDSSRQPKRKSRH